METYESLYDWYRRFWHPAVAAVEAAKKVRRLEVARDRVQRVNEGEQEP